MRLVFFIIPLLFSQMILADNIYIIGKNVKGEELLYQAKASEIHQNLYKTVMYQKSVAVNELTKFNPTKHWSLDKFSLGLGLEGDIGIAFWQLGFAVKQRLFFKKN